MRRSTSILLGTLAVVLLVLASYGAGRLARSHLWPGSAAWADEAGSATTLQARAERHGTGQDETGTVFLNDKQLFTVETLAGGLTGYERAMIVAKRLNDAFAAGAAPGDFTASVAQGLNVVLWRTTPLITVDDALAQKLGKPRAQVAEEWAAAIRSAMRQILGLPEPPPPPPPTQPASGQGSAGGGQAATAQSGHWTPSEPYDEKDVLIVSLGEGKQLGMARVKGPRSRVKLVQAVAAIETHYKHTLEVEIYVPISTKVPGKKLDRVQGVGVVGIAKFRF